LPEFRTGNWWMTVDSLQLTVSTTEDLPKVRRRLAEWLDQGWVPEENALGLVLAAHEAIANALTHSATTEPVSISAAREDEHVTVEIVDAGTWAAPADKGNGWGLLIMRRATTSATIETNEDGTRVSHVQVLHARV